MRDRSLKNTKAASKFANRYIDKLDLSYTFNKFRDTSKFRDTIIADSRGHVTMEILCEKIALDKIDIMNRVDEIVGCEILRCLEYKTGNDLNKVRKALLK